MDVTFIDPEPPSPVGGGIRTYFRLALAACREHGVSTRIFTHNPEAYPGEAAFAIGRQRWLSFPWRGMAYRLAAGENALWEHSRWLEAELVREDGPGRVYEFCDFLGYGFFALRNKALRSRSIVRIHTPNFLVNEETRFGSRTLSTGRLLPWIAETACRRREIACLATARHITVPSPQFMAEKLPTRRSWIHIPNPVPVLQNPTPDVRSRPGKSLPEELRILCLGRVEPRKGTLDLVKAFLEFARTRRNASLTLVGNAGHASYSQAVRDLIQAAPPGVRDRVAWEPACAPEQRAEMLRRFNVLAVPSRWENSPYVYFEGMAAGLLCLGSATGEMKSVAAITGAPLAKPGDVTDWIRALESLASGAGEESLLKQADYLRRGQSEIPRQMIEYYRRVGNA